MNDHIVYIVGAGFSTLAGMPVVSNFLQYMLSAQAWCMANGYEEESSAISRIIQARRESIGAGYRTNIDLDNIEHLFSYLTIQNAESQVYMPIAIAGTLEYAKSVYMKRRDVREVTLTKSEASTDDETLRSYGLMPGGTRSIPVYEWLVAQMIGNNALIDMPASVGVITFNYDTLIEDAMAELNIAYSYGLEKSSNKTKRTAYQENSQASVPILKIHGSMNWTTIQNTGIAVHESYESLRKGFKKPIITPPVWNKESKHSVRKCWDRAIVELSKATHIVILGYSFPATDVHTRYLVAAGLQSNVTLRHVVVVDNYADKVATELSQFIIGKRLASRDILHYNISMQDFALQNMNVLRDVGVSPARTAGWSRSSQ